VFFEREGYKYQPDLVVLGFVLNDVTERFQLRRFGGGTDGAIAEHAPQSRLDYWMSRSAAVAAARRWGAMLRFGSDVAAGARKSELASLREVAGAPDRPELARAWEMTFEDLEGLERDCRMRAIPLVLVLFPCRFQLRDLRDSSGRPQRKLVEFANDRGIPVLDLMPDLQRRIAEAKGPRRISSSTRPIRPSSEIGS